MKPDILGYTLEECCDLAVELGDKKFRGQQLFGWMQKGAPLSEMKNLPAAFRQKIAEECDYRLPEIAKKQVSKKDGTVKYLMRMTDGECVESVFMRYEHGNTVCVSCQAGCRMGCKFCASTIGGKVRDLLPSEMLGQVYAATDLSGERVDSIVMMGIGEPLDNYDNVIRFLELVHDPDGLNLSHRHISLSTCGVVPRINELADKKYQLTLSISLHACDNETRNKTMPVNKAYPIEELLAACKRYFAATGRRISYEYALIAGVNDSPEQAIKLAKLLSDQSCHVNLIPVNPVTETGFQRGSRKDAERFCAILNSSGLSATIRRELGTEIDAACGQLRRRDQREKEAKA